MRLHAQAAGVVGAYLEAVDREAPGLVEGLYLTGSAALGDFRPRTSDVDFVAVTACPLDLADLAALERAHARLRARLLRPFFDGIYVTWEELANDPALRRGPHSHEGRFHANGQGLGDPVTWHTLARYGVVCHGPALSNVRIRADAEVLAAWTLQNLDDYWRPLLRRASVPVNLWCAATLMSYGVVWIVLGLSRLHYTLATGALCSKEAAGEYALQAFPQRWRRVVHESLRIRRADFARPDVSSALLETMDFLRIRRTGTSEGLYPTPVARRRDTLAFGEMVITDAKRQYGRASPDQILRDPSGRRSEGIIESPR